jgi:very-short-patch-repair endonuclease
LRSRQVHDAKFRRQQPVGPFIVDFYCEDASLVIEIDGSHHLVADNVARDEERTKYLQEFGLVVLRFTNLEVLKETEGMLMKIWYELDQKFPSP